MEKAEEEEGLYAPLNGEMEESNGEGCRRGKMEMTPRMKKSKSLMEKEEVEEGTVL